MEDTKNTKLGTFLAIVIIAAALGFHLCMLYVASNP